MVKSLALVLALASADNLSGHWVGTNKNCATDFDVKLSPKELQIGPWNYSCPDNIIMLPVIYDVKGGQVFFRGNLIGVATEKLIYFTTKFLEGTNQPEWHSLRLDFNPETGIANYTHTVQFSESGPLFKYEGTVRRQ